MADDEYEFTKVTAESSPIAICHTLSFKVDSCAERRFSKTTNNS